MNNNFYPQFSGQFQSPYPQRQSSNGITWVQGIEGAKAFQLMPNSNTLLMDSENDGIFYIKVCDNVGMCSLRTFKYEELTNFVKKPDFNVDLSQYITRDELETILDNKLNGGQLNGKPTLQSIKSNNSNGKQLPKQSTSNADA